MQDHEARLHDSLLAYLRAAEHEFRLLELKKEYEERVRSTIPRDIRDNGTSEHMLARVRSYTIHLIIQ